MRMQRRQVNSQKSSGNSPHQINHELNGESKCVLLVDIETHRSMFKAIENICHVALLLLYLRKRMLERETTYHSLPITASN